MKHSPGNTISKYIWIHLHSYLGPSIFLGTIYSISSLTHQQVARWNPSHLLPESSCVCIPSFRPKSTYFFLPKYNFYIFNTLRGVVIYTYLKHSPGGTCLKYIWVHGSDSTCLSVNRGHMNRQTDNRLFPLYSMISTD